MKKLAIVLLALSLSACAAVTELSPGVTSEAYSKAVIACNEYGGVRMVNQSIAIKYTAYCNDGHMTKI